MMALLGEAQNAARRYDPLVGQLAVAPGPGSQLANFAAKHEAQAVIEAVLALNSATDRARRAGWIVALSIHPQDASEWQASPDPMIHRELRASIAREV